MTDTINTQSQGSGGTQYTPEDLAIQGASSSLLQQIGQLGETLAEEDSLTASEKQQLETLASVSMPLLPPADQQKLSNWLQILAAYPTSTTSSSQNISYSVESTQALLSGPPASNPFMQPGIMAILAPILAKLLPIMNQIIRQDSVLSQALMGLTQNMAQEAYSFAVAAGQQKVAQLNDQVAQYASLAATSAIQGAFTIGLAVSYQKADDAIDEGAPTAPSLDDPMYPEGTDDPQYQEDYDTWFQQDGNPATAPQADAPQYTGENDPEFIKAQQDYSQKYQAWKSEAYSQHQALYQKQQTKSQVLQSAFSSVSNIIQASTTAAQTGAVTAEATDTAMNNYLSSMSQVIQQSMQKAVDDEKSANDALKGIFQLYDQIASSITRALYHG